MPRTPCAPPPSNAAHHPSVCRGVSLTPSAYARCSNEWPLRQLWITPKYWAATVPGMGALEPGAASFKSREEKMVGRRASTSLHHYQKFSCVLAPIGDHHYSAAARSASCSSRIVGLPAWSQSLPNQVCCARCQTLHTMAFTWHALQRAAAA